MSLNKAPEGERLNIGIYGNRNAGKSSLLNAITAQNTSLVSTVKGTTADPVKKPMELLSVGPVLFIDTAGLDDKGKLGSKRAERSLQMLQRTDFALYVMDAQEMDRESLQEARQEFKKFNIPYLVVVNKIDRLEKERLQQLKQEYTDFIFVAAAENENILYLKDKLKKRIKDNARQTPILGDLVPYNGRVIMVVPIDSEAPQGRLILPQVQSIRDCLDHGIKSLVVRDTELESGIQELKKADLVVTDSQAFGRVDEIVPNSINLTSFSILFARYKGDLKEFISGLEVLKEITPDTRLLISETCTHDVSCEDIGRVKIPNLIKKNMVGTPEIEVIGGKDFPENLSEYDLVIHCGACMLNQQAMQSRIKFCRDQGVPITNYGMTLAYYNGILDRALDIFEKFNL